MARIQLILLLLLSGCATYTSDPSQFVTAGQTQTLIQAVAGPNPISSGIIAGQNYYRETDAILQNPWDGFFQLRNLWLH